MSRQVEKFKNFKYPSSVENLNQVRTDRQTVDLRFSWEGVLNRTWISPWTQKGILPYGLDPRRRSVTYVVMDDETSVYVDICLIVGFLYSDILSISKWNVKTR